MTPILRLIALLMGLCAAYGLSAQTDDELTTHYNVEGNVTPMRWDITMPDNRLGRLADRLAKVGQRLPQEKVYLHMDNTCYYKGDTIWFAAYLRQTSDDRISSISGILYVELLNQDGYLMERKMVETTDGRGHGAFYLDPEWYSGYYELRAYTRWQLNWGVYERKHSTECEYWFINEEMEHRYFRDYEKLYSRVFPVYDAPATPGAYGEKMTLRQLSRGFKNDPDKPKLQLSLYPEGGELINGVPCRVAFEAAYSDGQFCDGNLTIDTLTVAVQDRGRGVFEYTPERGSERRAHFKAKNGETVSARLPKAEKDGVALQVMHRDSLWHIRAAVAGTVRRDTLAMTIMHEGRVRHFWLLKDTVEQFAVGDSELECGVNQATVFDADGRIYADRLFFVGRKALSSPSLSIAGVKESYEPYERISLDVSTAEQTAATVSLSVRDKETSNQLFDNASMMAEMLLSSEIRGFVPSPDWYFEKDDAQHRDALDLLMMTQGWRRFDWRKMAVRGEWDLTQPDERTPIIVGDLFRFYPGYFYHPKDTRYFTGAAIAYNHNADIEDRAELRRATEAEIDQMISDRLEEERLNHRRRIKGSVLVHAELAPIGYKKPATVESTTQGGRFRFALPRFYDPAVFFISASDTAKWKGKKKKRYNWIQKMPDEWDRRKFRAKDGEFSIRVDWPYPRFVKPYNHYQQRVIYADESLMETRTLDDGTRQLGEVKVRAKRRANPIVVDSIPAFMVDAYEAYNFALDAGMLSADSRQIARAYVGDYGLETPYTYITRSKNGSIGAPVKDNRLRRLRGSDDVRRVFKGYTLDEDSVNMRSNLLVEKIGIIDPNKGDEAVSPYVWSNTYEHLNRIEKYVIYTDYQPRLIGSSRYFGSNLPYTCIAICPYPNDGERMFYRDRRYILPGIDTPAEFYHPDYSQRVLPADTADYRRTLYWNPDLRLDANGHATVTFWNNARTSQIVVSAEGVTGSGQIIKAKE